MSRKYTIKYHLHRADEEREMELFAHNKYSAYDRAVYDYIPLEHGEVPYSAWVESYRTAAGKVHFFKSFEGNPYGDN